MKRCNRITCFVRHNLKLVTAALILMTGSLAVTAQAADVLGQKNVLRTTLNNGMQVIIVRNTLAPVVSTSINYLVGADETPPGFPGTAHAQEHMMFRGSAGLSADQLANIGSIMGGSFNADTRQTVTQYYYTVPSEDLDVALHIESLRMHNVLDTQKDWSHERGAIEQEVAQDLSNPQYILYTKLRTAMFSGTPYATDGLGTKPSFDKTNAKMLKSFHDKWYAPNNAILVVAGDLDLATTLSKIRDLFGDIQAKKLPARKPIRLNPVKPQSFSLNSDLPIGMEAIAMRMPGMDSPDYPALEVLSDVLSSERGALFELVPQGKALSAGFSFDPLPKAGMGMATVTYPASGDPVKLEHEVRAILAQVARDGVPADLVDAAKLQERRDAEFQKNSISGLANVWSEAVAVDGLSSPEEDLARIEQVTPEDVNRAARKYLDLNHALVAVLTPHTSGKPVAASGFGGQESIALGEAKPTPLPDWAMAALHRLNVPAKVINPTVSQLPNGITLVVQPEDVSKTVTVMGHIRNRADLEVPKGEEGVDTVLAHLFPYGSEKLDRIALQSALDKIGASEMAGTDFQLAVLKDNFDQGVSLLADNELHPGLPENAFKIVQRQVSETVSGQLHSPSYLADRALRTALFPADDPELRETVPATVDKLTLDQVRDYYHLAFRPDLTVIVVIGDIKSEEARTVIEKYFGDWHATGPKPNTLLPTIPDNNPVATAVPDTSRIQDEVILGESLGLTRSNPDYYALRLGNSVLGGGFYSTRLTRDLRKNAGLVYSVGASFNVGRSRGFYFIQYACDPKNVTKVHASIVKELDDMKSTPVTSDELQRAKAILLRQIALDDGSTNSIAGRLIALWDLDLPFDEPTHEAQQYINLDAGDVQAAFTKWVRPQGMVRITQGP